MSRVALLSLFVAALLSGCVRVPGEGAVAMAVSPDGQNEIRLWTAPLAYDVQRNGQVVVARSEIGLKVDGVPLAPAHKPRVSMRRLKGSVETPVYKKASVDLAAEETRIDFGDWSVRLVARNDGVAYRFETAKPGTIRVNCEKATLALPSATTRALVYRTAKIGDEEAVPQVLKPEDITTKGAQSIYLPLVYQVGGVTVAMTESDVCDYPILNYQRTGGAGTPLIGNFAKWPTRTFNAANWKRDKPVDQPGRWVVVAEEADYLVETDGTRTFPWRTFALVDEPSRLCEADLVMALARAQAEDADFSWVKPGKVAWDWWNAWDNQGNEGCNTKTYERFIDFAAANGVEYVIFDEGWSENLNIWKFASAVDVPYLIDYANGKGVGIILWMAWGQVVGQEEKVAAHFAQLGAKGFKVDFMDRGDAACERFLWKFAEACSRHHMLVDYHGAHRPTGMSRAYPNVLNYEGIYGLENMKFYGGQDMMLNDVACFYGRLSAGPMDYTPGAMDNYPLGTYPVHNPKFGREPGSLGTRSRQMAMLVLYEAPLQMLCDAPTKYEANRACFAFMSATPVVWRDTRGLGGDIDSYAAAARQAKDGSWYAAALGNAARRDMTISTDFLEAGDWQAEIFRDAPDCEKSPTHYVHETRSIRAGENLSLGLEPGGGFVIHFTR